LKLLTQEQDQRHLRKKTNKIFKTELNCCMKWLWLLWKHMKVFQFKLCFRNYGNNLALYASTTSSYFCFWVLFDFVFQSHCACDGLYEI